MEQVDLDELDDEEAMCVALRNMSIGDVCPKESEKPPHAQDQPSSSTLASPPTQNEDEAQVDEGSWEMPLSSSRFFRLSVKGFSFLCSPNTCVFPAIVRLSSTLY